ncbi:MAG: sulfite exporter TauE/SafE family protein [Psychrobium sp.]|nr:sulfite exporter TauE/SafE family protein [Psychrobium sp.]
MFSVLQGSAIGVVTGFVGVCGGFLLVPALVIWAGQSMRSAIATSLVIIVLNASAGSIKYHEIITESNQQLDWTIIGVMSFVGIAGSLIGQRLAGRWDQQKIKRIFAIFLLVMASYILIQSIVQI